MNVVNRLAIEALQLWFRPGVSRIEGLCTRQMRVDASSPKNEWLLVSRTALKESVKNKNEGQRWTDQRVPVVVKGERTRTRAERAGFGCSAPYLPTPFARMWLAG